MSVLGLFYVFAFGVAISMLFSGLMIHAGLGDVPDMRSNHTQTTPTAGGVGSVAAIGASFLFLQYISPDYGFDYLWPTVLSLTGAVALLGLIDDIIPIRATLKFGMMMGLSALAVRYIGPVTELPLGGNVLSLPYALGFVGSVLWVFVVTNVVNFMDGSNGLMPCVMVIACLALVAICLMMGASQIVWLPLSLAAGLVGFLPYNARTKALIFSGDVGSLTVGFGFAVSVLWLCAKVPHHAPVYIGPVLLLPFLVDSLLTILKRLKSGENLMEPHKRHLYQGLISQGYTHLRVASIYTLAGMLVAVLAIWVVDNNWQSLISFLWVPTLMLSGLYYITGRKF